MMLIFTNPNRDESTSYSKYVELHHNVRQEAAARRLRYVRNGNLVELKRVTQKDFQHLEGLEASDCFHLFLSRDFGLSRAPCVPVSYHPLHPQHPSSA
jgi:hypothetical protein